MQTSKDLSNISYNTVGFLKSKLEYLRSIGLIDFWFFIKHKPEMESDNRANKKEHIHLMFRPGKRIHTNIIGKEFLEEDPGNNLPLKCTDDWRIVNSFADWYLYALHDPTYLMHKHLVREFHYSVNDFIVSDKDTFERMISFIDLSEMYRMENMFNAAAAGWSYKTAMAKGIFGEHPQRYAAMYSALLQDNAAERYQRARSEELKYAKLAKRMAEQKERK